MNLLVAENLTVRYGGYTALDRVSLPPLDRGQIVGVIGPNASGKSTLLRALADGSVQEGTARLAGRPLDQISAGERRRLLALLPQSLPQPSALYAYELVMAHARAANLGLSGRELEERVSDIFERLELTALALRPLRELSGGKRQLVGVAMTFVRQPQLLLLDEPTSALDLRWQFILMAQVRSFVDRRQAGCIVALHDVNIALRYCDAVVLLDGGRVAASGTPGTVVTRENLAKVYGVEADVRVLEHGHTAVAIHGPINKGREHAQVDKQF